VARTGTSRRAEPERQPPPYEQFVRDVTAAQLLDWLPAERQWILDLSPGCPVLLELMLAAGHNVVHATAAGSAYPSAAAGLHRVVADRRRLDWVGEGRIDGVVAEGSALSTALAAEVTLDDLFAALRPGGRLLLAVDSLLAGLSHLARDGRWAELADVPSADVVLVPSDNGSVTRCFWPEELDAMLAGAGFRVEWIRPRTVLSEGTVGQTLGRDPEQLPTLVQTELRLAVEREGESLGAQLVASAVRP
jgi:hypothetical protein